MIAASVEQRGRVLQPPPAPVEIPACMGGWCSAREGCGHYYHASRLEPSERLCAQDRRDAFVPVKVGTRP